MQQLVAVDATGNLAVDQVIALPKIGSVSAHSVAANYRSRGLIFSPNNGGISVFTPSTFDADDPNSPRLAGVIALHELLTSRPVMAATFAFIGCETVCV